MLTASAQLEGPVGDLSFGGGHGRVLPGGAGPRRIAVGHRHPAHLAREAVVVGAITPWNFLHQINLAKLGPALLR